MPFYPLQISTQITGTYLINNYPLSKILTSTTPLQQSNIRNSEEALDQFDTENIFKFFKHINLDIKKHKVNPYVI